MNDLSFIFPILIKILNIYVIFKKGFKRILKYRRSHREWENLELWLQLQGKHGSGLQLQIPDHEWLYFQYRHVYYYLKSETNIMYTKLKKVVDISRKFGG